LGIGDKVVLFQNQRMNESQPAPRRFFVMGKAIESYLSSFTWLPLGILDPRAKFMFEA